MDEVTVMLDGKPFEHRTEIDIDLSFETASNECSIKLTEMPPGGLPCHRGSELQVLIDGRPVITGNVNSIKGDTSWTEHRIEIKGKDKTSDFVRSKIGPKNDFRTPITLESVLRRTIGNMGLQIPVRNLAGGLPPFRAGEVVSGDIVQGGMEFAEKWARKRQVFLNTDGTGALTIQRGDGRLGSGALLHAVGPGSEANNVLSSSYSIGEDGCYNSHAMSAQKSPNDDDFWEGKDKGEPLAKADEMANRFGLAHDSSIRPELRNFFRGNQGAEGKTPHETAQWHANVARARGFTYDCEVQGFHQSAGAGDLWWPGLLVSVRDDDWEISAILFLKTVHFTKTWDGGSKSKLGLTYEDAYRPGSASAPRKTGRTSRLGVGSVEPGSYDTPDEDDLGIRFPEE
jgi:prophage tail gpP-like protein